MPLISAAAAMPCFAADTRRHYAYASLRHYAAAIFIDAFALPLLFSPLSIFFIFFAATLFYAAAIITIVIDAFSLRAAATPCRWLIRRRCRRHSPCHYCCATPFYFERYPPAAISPCHAMPPPPLMLPLSMPPRRDAAAMPFSFTPPPRLLLTPLSILPPLMPFFDADIRH